jgi:hypothetical protein
MSATRIGRKEANDDEHVRRADMKMKILNGLGVGLAVTGLLFVGAARAEASTITLAEGDSSVSLCLPTSPTVNPCATKGLSNWVVNGVTHSFSQWFSFATYADPAWGSTSVLAWSGAIDALSTPTVTQSTPSTASVSYMNWNLGTWPDASSPLQVGLKVDYALTGSGSGPSHIKETVTLFNPTYYFLYNTLTDGLGVNVSHVFAGPYDSTVIATADYTPNPEPMSMILLGTGLLAVARARRRQATMA